MHTVSRFSLTSLKHPIVQAPMAGGPSTPALAAAVWQAGGLGFLGAGYKTVDAVREDIAALRELADGPFGVNLFAPPGPPGRRGRGRAVRRGAERRGASATGPTSASRATTTTTGRRSSKLMRELAVPVVSFTFGCPARGDVARPQAAGCAVWITVTTPEEATRAAEAGADALVVQGTEAGGHRGDVRRRRARRYRAARAAAAGRRA